MLSVEITIERRWEGQFPIVLQEIESGHSPARQVGVLHFEEETRRELTAVAEIDPLKYGTILGQAIFQDRVRDQFVAARARGDDEVLLGQVGPSFECARTGVAVRSPR